MKKKTIKKYQLRKGPTMILGLMTILLLIIASGETKDLKAFIISRLIILLIAGLNTILLLKKGNKNFIDR